MMLRRRGLAPLELLGPLPTKPPHAHRQDLGQQLFVFREV